MAASGIGLSLFVLVHMAGNSTSFFGKEAFLSYARHLHSLGILLHFGEIFMLCIFILHVISAWLSSCRIRLTATCRTNTVIAYNPLIGHNSRAN